MNFKRILMLALASVLCLCVLCTVGCDEGEAEQQSTEAATNAPENTEATTEAPAATEEVTTNDGKVTYTVTVVDANGAPVAGAAVQFCDDNGCRMPIATNAEGVAALTDAESNFHVTLASVPAGFVKDENEYYFDGAFELTITLNAE